MCMQTSHAVCAAGSIDRAGVKDVLRNSMKVSFVEDRNSLPNQELFTTDAPSSSVILTARKL